MVILAAGIGSFLAVVPDQAIVRIIAGTIRRPTAVAELTGLALCPVFGSFRGGVNFGACFRSSGSGVSVSGKRI